MSDPARLPLGARLSNRQRGRGGSPARLGHQHNPTRQVQGVRHPVVKEMMPLTALHQIYRSIPCKCTPTLWVSSREMANRRSTALHDVA
jgi:hypothetical protein